MSKERLTVTVDPHLVQAGHDAVAEGRVYVTDFAKVEGEVKNDPGGRIDLKGKERVLCFDAKSGEPIWKHEYDCEYKISYPAGPLRSDLAKA